MFEGPRGKPRISPIDQQHFLLRQSFPPSVATKAMRFHQRVTERVPALIALLSAVGLLDAAEQRELGRLAEPPVLNSTGLASAGKGAGRYTASCGMSAK